MLCKPILIERNGSGQEKQSDRLGLGRRAIRKIFHFARFEK